MKKRTCGTVYTNKLDYHLFLSCWMGQPAPRDACKVDQLVCNLKGQCHDFFLNL